MTLTALNDTEASFRADPAAGRVTPSVTATLVNGHARLSSGPFNWEADLPPTLGGENLAPSPTAYLLGALAGCGVAFLADTLAPQFGVTIESIRAVARCDSDLGGLLGIEGASPALAGIAIEIEVTSPDGPEATGPMLRAWEERCPVFLALRHPNDVALTTRVAAPA